MIVLDTDVVSEAMKPEPDAAVAASRGFIVASRDTSPYEAVGVTVIDPWKDV